MRHEEADAKRRRLERGDQEHTYVVRAQPSGEWEVVRTSIPPPRLRPTSDAVAERAEAAAIPTTDAEQAAELADAARRLKSLRERRARLADVATSEPAAPLEEPRATPIHLPPGFG